mgnify:CR=1 FL=1
MFPPLIDEKSLAPDPISQFEIWFNEAIQTELNYPNACCLSTVGLDNVPDGRIVLLRSFDTRGFVFFTNYNSIKGGALGKIPQASMTFYWDILRRQVRIQGDVARVSDTESDSYFAARPREAQLGAWASLQSKPLASREELEVRLSEITNQFNGMGVPRPSSWGGYRVIPFKYEFWQEQPARLHDRFQYRQNVQGDWQISRLYP